MASRSVLIHKVSLGYITLTQKVFLFKLCMFSYFEAPLFECYLIRYQSYLASWKKWHFFFALLRKQKTCRIEDILNKNWIKQCSGPKMNLTSGKLNINQICMCSNIVNPLINRLVPSAQGYIFLQNTTSVMTSFC